MLGRGAVASLIKLFATGLGLGYIPKLPGTAGSVLGIVLVWIFAPLSFGLYLSVVVTLTIIAIWISDQAEGIFQEKDSQKIVIDEVVGVLVTFIAVPLTGLTAVIGFVLFRFFDIVKPPPIRQSQKLKGGLGVVIDDVAAGVFANIVLQVLIRVLSF